MAFRGVHLPEQLHIHGPGIQLLLPPPRVQSDAGGCGWSERRGCWSGRALEVGLGPDGCSQPYPIHLPCVALVSCRLGLQSLQWPGRGQRMQRICRV